ncbi:MAG: ATP-binding protein [Sulfurovaceae bacterium]
MGKVEQIKEEKPKEDAILNKLICATLEGANAKVIDVEATFTKGLPGFTVVGLASSDIQESKDRVKSALLTNEFHFPPLKITINLGPSDLKKSGTHFDLSLALLIASNKTKIEQEGLYVFGELGLDGRVKSSSMLFPIILSLKEQGLIKRAIVPKEAMEYLAYISGVDFIPVESLLDALRAIKGDIKPQEIENFSYDAKVLKVAEDAYYYNSDFKSDFLDIKGQKIAKRAALIAAAGMHNFLMQGNPGCGKSMIAKRIIDILPPLDEKEILSIAKHQFLDGVLPDFVAKRPMRSPHHTATIASIFGGGSVSARIGEVALAHKGILFFDELPHFSKQTLEALREPLQESKPCRCNESEIKRYTNRLSDPFLDRIDIFVTMQEVSKDDSADISSKEMLEKVLQAFVNQKSRAQERLNGKLNEEEIERFCLLSIEAQAILESAIAKFALTHRSIASIKKVARTIADLEGAKDIEKPHLLEALSYRRRK